MENNKVKNEKNVKNVKELEINEKFFRKLGVGAALVVMGSIAIAALARKSCTDSQVHTNETNLESTDLDETNIKETDTFETEPYENETTSYIYGTDPYETEDTSVTIPYETEYETDEFETESYYNEETTSSIIYTNPQETEPYSTNSTKPGSSTNSTRPNHNFPSRPIMTEEVTQPNTNPQETEPLPTQKPTNPTQPSSSTNPTQKPTNPTQPSSSINPTQKPTNPTQPSSSINPTQKPTNPTQPSSSTNPTQKPTDPEDVTKPIETETEHVHIWKEVSTSYVSVDNGTHIKVTTLSCSCGKTMTKSETESCTFGPDKNIGYEYVGNAKHAMKVEHECIYCDYETSYYKASENCDLTGTRVTLSDGLTVTVECPYCLHDEVVHKHNLSEPTYRPLDNDCCIEIRTCKVDGCDYSIETVGNHVFAFAGSSNTLLGKKYVCIHCGKSLYSKEDLTAATSLSAVELSYNENSQSQMKSLSSVGNAVNIQNFNQNFKIPKSNTKTYGMNDYINNQKYKQKVLRYSQRKY